jgi:hypothetical protein
LKEAQGGPKLEFPNAEDREREPGQTLTAGLVRFMADCGVMKAAVHGAIEAARQ